MRQIGDLQSEERAQAREKRRKKGEPYILLYFYFA